MILSDKDPAEKITVTFDFSGVADALIAAEMAVSVLSGVADANPSAIISGAVSIARSLVMQQIASGQHGTIYQLRCTGYDADGEVHVLTAALPVRRSRPM